MSNKRVRQTKGMLKTKKQNEHFDLMLKHKKHNRKKGDINE